MLAERVLSAMEPENGTRASMLAGLGRTDEALSHLARFRPGASALGATFYTIVWATARRDPRYAAALTKLGCLAEYETAEATMTRMRIGEST